MGASGVNWNALDEAVRVDQAAAIKGPSLDAVIDVLDQLIGRLQVLPPDQEFTAGGARSRHQVTPNHSDVRSLPRLQTDGGCSSYMGET